MIHGVGIGVKYNHIIQARSQELFVNVTNNFEQKINSLLEFKETIRNCSLVEFEEWYQLYKDVVINQPKRKKK